MNPAFRIAAAQVPSVRGDIETNIATHASAMISAAKHGVSVLVFPELSLTGYEPDLGSSLAITTADGRLAPLIALARQHGIATVIGAPLQSGIAKPALGAILITAAGVTTTYQKMHLGANEKAYFASGTEPLTFSSAGHVVGLAICADASQPSHPKTYADLGADIYAASVFLNDEWYATDMPRFGGYASQHRMLTVVANHAASVGTYSSVGKSVIWSPDGRLLVQAGGVDCVLVMARFRNGKWEGDVLGIDRPI